MWNRIVNFANAFKKALKQKDYVSALKFKQSIKALGMELYKGVTILYLEKPIEGSDKLQPIYHFFHKKEFYFKEADTFEELQSLAREDIDALVK